jgi:hypothetical protein
MLTILGSLLGFTTSIVPEILVNLLMRSEGLSGPSLVTFSF